MTPIETLQQLKTTTRFAALGDAVGNLTLGRGTLNGHAVHVAIIENKIAAGSVGVKECDKLASLFRIIAVQKSPLLIYIDSAGARVSEGLPALGAFRHMYRAAAEMALSGAPITAFLGTHCYGGASMLAALAGQRVFSTSTQLAMSGPTILAAAAGVSSLDDAFRAIAEASIGAAARAKLSPQNSLTWNSAVQPPLNQTDKWVQIHEKLGSHPTVAAAFSLPQDQRQFGNAAGGVEGRPEGTVVQRKDVAALYPDGYQAFELGNIFYGKAKAAVDVKGANGANRTSEANRASEAKANIRLLGIVDRRLLGAARTWALADRVWKLAFKKPERLHILVDCEAHSAQIDDERAMLSCYLADLTVALLSLARAGTEIETTVLGRAGGGVYVALAAASQKVNLLHGADIQLLPSRAVASILGDADTQIYTIADYAKARVAEDELKVGFLRR